MEEVEQIASRIVIMDKGKDIVSGTTEQLKEMISTSEKIVVSFLEIEDKVVSQINNIKNVMEVEKVNGDFLI